jgi:hypothetical protein
MKNIPRQLTTPDPAKQPAQGSEKGKDDPATKHQPDDNKSGSKPDPSMPHQPSKAGGA